MLVLGAFITPPYLGAIGWILLAGPNSGWLNQVWMAVTGAHEGLFNIYSFEGLAFNIAIYSFPYIFIFTAAALGRCVVGNGGRGEYPGRRGHPADDLADHPADGAAGDPGRGDRHLSGGDRPVRLPGADRDSRRASAW
jgi:hypothetical protein